jgi:hypothetical protein
MRTPSTERTDTGIRDRGRFAAGTNGVAIGDLSHRAEQHRQVVAEQAA